MKNSQMFAHAVVAGIKAMYNEENQMDKVNEIADLFQDLAMALEADRSDRQAQKFIECLIDCSDKVEEVGTHLLG